MSYVQLSTLQAGSYFRRSNGGHVLLKTSLHQNGKIGAYNPFGQLLWIDPNSTVMILNEEKGFTV